MESITSVEFCHRRRDYEELYLLLNDQEIISGTWEQLYPFIPSITGLTAQIINDIANYGNCSFKYKGTKFQLFNNKFFYDFLEVICSKNISLLAEYFNTHKLTKLNDEVK